VVHYHFANKDDLIGRVLTQCCDVMADRVRAAWTVPGTPLDRIRRALRELWATRTDGSPEMRVLAELMAQGVHDPNIKQALAARFQHGREELIRELMASFDALGLRPKVPPQTIPRIVIATLDGLGLHQIFDPPGDDDQKEIIRALELFAFSLFEM
jgi:AcrR family transcriptional regulator